jgi:hypothetical protein
MNYGFTGPREHPQTHAECLAIDDVLSMLRRLPDVKVITGGCVGIDEYVAVRATQFGLYVMTILPADRSAIQPDWHEYCQAYEDTYRTYGQRNQRIVDLSDKLVAFPCDDEKSQPRSGTWMTVRMARRKGIPVEIVRLDQIAG